MATNKPEDQKRYEANFRAKYPKRRIEYAVKHRNRYPERYRARNYVAVLVYQGKLNGRTVLFAIVQRHKRITKIIRGRSI